MAAWWRCELDADGKVVDCRRVKTKPRNPGNHVVYVLAADERDAWRKGHALYQRMLTTARHARNEAQGLCRCGRDRDDPNLKRCAFCRGSERDTKLRRAGKLPPMAPGEKAAKQMARRREAVQETRLNVLLEVAAKLMTLRDVRAFRAWLGDEIRRAGGRSEAA
jgi:hypothetical protein